MTATRFLPTSDRERASLARPHVALLVETSLASGRDIVRGVARYAREHGPWSVFHEPRGLEDATHGWLQSWRGDGIIARLQTRKFADAIAEAGIPAVDVLGVASHPEIPLVHVDNRAIARMAAEHLLERGFKHFGFCSIENVNWSELRREAFVEHVRAAGHDVAVYSLPRQQRGLVTWEDQQDQIAEWIRGLPKPVGVMACNDPRGQKVLEACRRGGLAVPDLVAVIGVDNDEPICEISDPPLSSVYPDPTRVGYEAAKLLESMMRGGARPAEPVLLPPLCVVTRHSTDVLAMHDREVAEAVRFIREHACQGIGVEDVVNKLLLSRSSLHRRFRDALGRTVHEEIVRVRVARARELLAETDMPIVQVAERAGFRHQEYLGAVFKTHVGQTPARYRRETRGK